ncbi:MAG: hypothetical protein ACMXYG_03515 [Candidatus Woesearchaeota archaeon]
MTELKVDEEISDDMNQLDQKDRNNSDDKTVSRSSDTLELGGHIELTGFVGLMPGSMTIIKKIVGTYTKRYTDLVKDFQKLNLAMKPIHHTTDKPKIFHINAKMIHEGRVTASEAEDRNIFHAIDSALKKIEAEITR